MPIGTPPTGYVEKATDNFNRADENPLGGNWTYRPETGLCDNRLYSNKVGGVTSNVGTVGLYNGGGALGSADEYSETLIASAVPSGTYNGPVLRGRTDETTFYGMRVMYGSGAYLAYDVYKAVNNTWTQMQGMANFIPTGNVPVWAGMRASGGSNCVLTIYHNYNGTHTDKTALSADSSIPGANYYGFYGQVPSSPTFYIDEWCGGWVNPKVAKYMATYRRRRA